MIGQCMICQWQIMHPPSFEACFVGWGADENYISAEAILTSVAKMQLYQFAR